VDFHTDQIYHIFNQGNNRNKIFFNDQNYIFFLKKVRIYVAPLGELLSYCLMPNHFHLLLYLKCQQIELPNRKFRSLNQSIGIMLMSYTSALNRQEGRSGSLFRARTKIEDGWTEDIITIKNKKSRTMFSPDTDYGRVCFEYIHNNPVKAHLVTHQTDWIYSSARDYAGLRNGTLCNQEFAKQLLIM
jgi:putative transposase